MFKVLYLVGMTIIGVEFLLVAYEMNKAARKAREYSERVPLMLVDVVLNSNASRDLLSKQGKE